MPNSPFNLSDLTPEKRSEAESRIEDFERAWVRGEAPRIVDYLPTDPEVRKAVLLEVVRIDIERRAKAGEVAQVEAYRHDFPELAALLAPDKRSGERPREIDPQPSAHFGQRVHH